MALRLSKQFVGKKVLDLGCGDGTFLAMLMEQKWAPSNAVGAEISAELVDDCRERLFNVSNLTFVSTEELDHNDHEHAYDAVFCMEVLEHVFDVETVLERVKRLVAPNGRVLISVPVEIGLPLLVKQTARHVAGWMGVGDYPGTTPYTLRELCAGLFAGPRQHVNRPVHVGENGEKFHDHKGFNWKLLREKIRAEFEIELTTASPLSWLPPVT